MSKFTVQVVSQNSKKFSMQGFVLEDGVQIASFKRKPLDHQGYIQDMEFKFFTSASHLRFENFCDSLTATETVEALATHGE